jgi:hypothetical protein
VEWFPVLCQGRSFSGMTIYIGYIWFDKVWKVGIILDVATRENFFVLGKKSVAGLGRMGIICQIFFI